MFHSNGRTVSGCSLLVDAPPAGVVVTAAPLSIAPGSTSSTLTIVAGPSAAVGAATLTVHATAPGVPERTEAFALTVTDAPAGGTTIWEFCRPADVPIWFAVQDGAELLHEFAVGDRCRCRGVEGAAERLVHEQVDDQADLVFQVDP